MISKSYFKLRNAIRLEKMLHRENAINNLWKRNGLVDVRSRDGYEIEEKEVVDRNGVTRIRFRLIKTVDQAELVINFNTESKLRMKPREEPNVPTT